MTTNEFTEIEWLLNATGYHEHAEEPDYDVAANATCEKCEQRGLDLRGFQKRTNGKLVSYRAFLVCPQCSDVYEF